MKTHVINCQCGLTSIELVGTPILSAICYCKDCQAAGRQFEQAPGAPSVLRADSGTDYCLYRKDRVKIVRGGENLGESYLTPDSKIRYVAAACCNTPMFLEFMSGHWLSVYRDRIPDNPPKPEMRVFIKGAPAGTVFEEDIPAHPKYSGKFMLKLFVAWGAMGFRRPKIILHQQPPE